MEGNGVDVNRRSGRRDARPARVYNFNVCVFGNLANAARTRDAALHEPRGSYFFRVRYVNGGGAYVAFAAVSSACFASPSSATV